LRGVVSTRACHELAAVPAPLKTSRLVAQRATVMTYNAPCNMTYNAPCNMTYNAPCNGNDIQRTTVAQWPTSTPIAAIVPLRCAMQCTQCTAAAPLCMAARVRHCEVAVLRCAVRCSAARVRQWPGAYSECLRNEVAVGLGPVAVQMWSAEASRRADVAAVPGGGLNVGLSSMSLLMISCRCAIICASQRASRDCILKTARQVTKRAPAVSFV
jgi:hypothetical protein